MEIESDISEPNYWWKHRVSYVYIAISNGRNKQRFVDMPNVETDEIMTWAETKNTKEKTPEVDCPSFWRFSRFKTGSSLITVIEFKHC